MSPRHLILISVCVFLSACATNRADYTAFRDADPRSILVLPALNESVDVTAPEYFLSTLSKPFAERGYYVFPAHMVKRTLEENGLSDTYIVYNADPTRLGALFGCDAALMVVIEKWESQYLVLSTTTRVQFRYALKSCHDGSEIWGARMQMSYTPDNGPSSGNAIVDLIAMAVTAAVEKAKPSYIPLAQKANAQAAGTPGLGIPAGPLLPAAYRKDLGAFPVAERSLER